MATQNAVDATPEQIENFLAGHKDGEPVYMLNLLKFKKDATYKDGEVVSGAEAYARYAKAFGAMLRDLKIEGVETVYGGKVGEFMIGQGEGEWDAVAIVRYADRKTMFAAVSNDIYRSFYKHRKAGLDGQLLIACDGSGVF
jgi:hypothetical protein